MPDSSTIIESARVAAPSEFGPTSASSVVCLCGYACVYVYMCMYRATGNYSRMSVCIAKYTKRRSREGILCKRHIIPHHVFGAGSFPLPRGCGVPRALSVEAKL